MSFGIRPVRTCTSIRLSLRQIHSSRTCRSHENPLGIPRRVDNPPPTLPRRGTFQGKTRIKGVKRVVVVASGKGGVGKSTVAGGSLTSPTNALGTLLTSLTPPRIANLALSLLQTAPPSTKGTKVGLLDLDIFGPSVPKLFGLEGLEPDLSAQNKLVPLRNHGVSTMSIGYLLPPNPANDSPVAWRGMMVMKAVQQLLFDVEWRSDSGYGEEDLDVLVIDMPPGTGDVQLSLGQLVDVDGAVIVSTPQDVALIDARKGVGMFRKVEIPIIGLLLNMSHFTCSSCTTPHELFGSAENFEQAASQLSLPVLAPGCNTSIRLAHLPPLHPRSKGTAYLAVADPSGAIPLVPTVSSGGDAGRPVMVQSSSQGDDVRQVMRTVGEGVWSWLASRPESTAGMRG